MRSNFLTRWLGFDTRTEAKKAARAGRWLRNRARLGLEQLEERQMLSIVEFCSTLYKVNERDTNVAIGVKLDAPRDEPVTVNYSTGDGTAEAGQDYTAANGTLEFAPGETMKMFPVVIRGDALAEGDENILLTLNGPSGNAALGGNSNAILKIQENLIATEIPSLFATGVDDQGNLLPGSAQDPHYTLVAPTDPAYQGPAVVPPAEDPPPPGAWFSSGTRSQWIAPAEDPFVPEGLYVYETTFELTADQVNDAVILGEWATDDTGAIFLNGHSTGITNPTTLDHFNSFTLSCGFVAGVNTLQFRVTNGPQASGLRVQFGDDDDVAPSNHAPVLDNSGDMNVGTIDEDQFDNNGSLVTTVLASTGEDRITDEDSGALEGIAVIGVDNTNGT